MKGPILSLLVVSACGADARVDEGVIPQAPDSRDADGTDIRPVMTPSDAARPDAGPDLSRLDTAPVRDGRSDGQTSPTPDGGPATCRSAIAPGTLNRWPDDGTHIRIPYVTPDRARYTAAAWANVQKALDELRAESRVRFVPRDGERDYVSIEFDPALNHCQVYRRGGYQWCKLNGNYWQISLHELLHAIGLQHEHQRADRDQHVVIDIDRVKPDFRDAYDKMSRAANPIFRPYDFKSVMHYSPDMFSIDGRDVMLPNPDRYAAGEIVIKHISQKPGLSKGDKENIEALYPRTCP